MKSKNKAFQLIEKGLTSETVSKLSESQIDILHKKMVGEQITKKTPKDSYVVGKQGGELPANPKGYEMNPNPDGTMTATAKESEMKEDETDDVTDSNSQGKIDLQKYTGQEAPHDANDMAPDGMDDDSDDDRKMMGMSEEKKKEQNPWAICTAQLGKEFGTRERHLWSAKEKNKYERCVKDVKKSLKEGKNPISLFLENEIIKIVEKHLPPKITKGDLMKYLQENGPATAPTKPGTKEKPDTKEKPGPTKPRIRPGKNPHPGEKEAPRAKKISHEDAKDNVIQTIMKLLKK
jgi:hypothetical protein